MVNTLLCVVAVLVQSTVAVPVDPFEPGPSQVIQWEYGSHRHPQPNISMHARIWAPSSANDSDGRLPVYAFVTAFGASVSVSDYNDIFTHAASHNIVVIGYDYGGGLVPDYLALGHRINDANKWMALNLHAEFIAHDVMGVPDLDKLAVGGHSAGNHIAVQALVYGCGFAKGLLMIDPVDGVDPYGFDKVYVIPTPPKQLNLTIPALHIETGLDDKSVGFGFPACAPFEMANSRFYNAMRGPTRQINATAYGHLDCIDDGNKVSVFGGLICAQNKTADKKAYRVAVGGWIVSFMHGLFSKGQGSMLNVLQSVESSPVAVEMQQKNLPPKGTELQPMCANPSTRILK